MSTAPRASYAWTWGVPALALAAMLIILGADANQALFLWLNRAGAPLGDAPWANLTLLGDSLVVIVLLLPFVGRKPDLIWAALLAAVLAMLWTHILKGALGVARPPAVLAPELFRVIGPAWRAGAFPSGHSTAIFTLAGILCLYFPRRGLRIFFVIAAGAIALSRIMVGVHWPLDVLGGAFGGWLAALGGAALAARLPWGEQHTAQRIIGVLLALAALVLLIDYNTGYQVQITQYGIALAALTAGLPGLIRLFKQRANAAP
ncbi:MAG: phosphatase PAP2 family protein [Pseudomonadota bacterium]